MSTLRRFIRWILLLYFITLAFLTLNPWILPDAKEAVGFITWDLIDHAIAYGGLSMLMLCNFKFKNYAFAFNMTFVVVLISGILGILFEYGQYFLTANRQFSFSDAAANLFGALFGVFVFWFLHLCRVILSRN